MSVEFVDTNILVYAHDGAAGDKHTRSVELLTQLFEDQNGALSVQHPPAGPCRLDPGFPALPAAQACMVGRDGDQQRYRTRLRHHVERGLGTWPALQYGNRA